MSLKLHQGGAAKVNKNKKKLPEAKKESQKIKEKNEKKEEIFVKLC